MGRPGAFLGGGRRPLRREPRRVLLRPDERAGRAGGDKKREIGSGPPLPASTSSSSSRWTRPPAARVARQWIERLAAAIRRTTSGIS